jgi:hypothetical protein
LTVTCAYLPPDKVIDGKSHPAKRIYHQMTLDRIDNPDDYYNAEYVLANTSIDYGEPVIRIPKTRPYYCRSEAFMYENETGSNEYKYYGKNANGEANGDFMWLVNYEIGNMEPDTWYLLPQAYSITLTQECEDERE